MSVEEEEISWQVTGTASELVLFLADLCQL